MVSNNGFMIENLVTKKDPQAVQKRGSHCLRCRTLGMLAG